MLHGRFGRWIKWRACDLGEAKEGLENELWRRWSDGKVGEWGNVTEGLENELWCRWSDGKVGEWATEGLGNESWCRFTYVTTHSPTLPSLYLRHSSFSNPSVASPPSKFILQPFFRFSYVTSSSLNSPGEPPMIHLSLHSITHKCSPITWVEKSQPRWVL